ncbi:hypothetical protein NDI39_10005 [Microcoleus sp. ZQ-A2]|nr:hypothetical protein [Microcoleus sp. FACHB-1]
MPRIKTGTWRDAKDAYEQLGIGQPPPSGLVPIGDTGLYGTPDTPASPFDCDRYPRSPYCGGNPIEPKLIGLDLETTVQVNPCGVTRSITANPTLLGISLPPASLAHIPENCREEYERQGQQTPPPPPKSDRDDYEPTPQYRPYGFDLDSQVCVVTQDYYYREVQQYYSNVGEWAKGVYQIYGQVDKSNYPSGDKVAWYNPSGKPPGSFATAIASVLGSYTAYNFLDENWIKFVWRLSGEYKETQTVPLNLAIPPDLPTVAQTMGYTTGGNYKIAFHYPTGEAFVKTVGVHVGRFGDIFPAGQISPITNENTLSDDKTTKIRRIHERFVVYCQKISGDSSGRRPPPLRKPPKDCCEDDMGCCQPPYGNRERQDNNELKRLLKEVLRRLGDFPITVSVFDANEDKLGAQTKMEKPANVASAIRLAIERNEKLAKIMGIDLLPITVPKTVIEKKGEGIFSQIFGFLDFNKNEEINSILEMQTWMFQQMSGILGHWMMEIEVEDNDPLTAGNQTKDGKTKDKKEEKKPEKVILPNMALTMREQVAMQIQTLKALGMLVDMQIKSLIDLAGTKVLSAECAARLEDLQLYFDYETEEVVEDLPLQITFPNLNGKREDVENLAKFLKEGMTKVTYDKWTVQKSQSMEEKIIQLLEMSSAIRALYFHNGA